MVEMPAELVKSAKKSGKVAGRSLAEQVEFWVKVGMAAEENPNLSFHTIKDQINIDLVKPIVAYQFFKDG